MTRRLAIFLTLCIFLLQGCTGLTVAATGTSTAASLAKNESGPKTLPKLFKTVSPAVVVIRTVEKRLTGKLKDGKAEEEDSYGLGSGVLISEDGKVLTAAHVVHTADVVAVAFKNGEQVAARVVGSAPRADVALLQLEKVPEGYQPAPLGNSDEVQIGESIMVIGAPYGISKTMTAGYISGRIVPEDNLFGSTDMEVFQSDVAVNSGNSGGPMFNMQGEVIGIVSSILTRSGGFEGISFAVTANTAKTLLLDRPSYWLGVDSLLLSETMAQVLNVPTGSGLLIQRVAQGSIGARLGLQSGIIPIKVAGHEFIAGGDIVIEVLGEPAPKDKDELKDAFAIWQKKVRAMQPGDEISVKVFRQGKILELRTPIE